ncbi:ribonuclease HIII [bacterium]|nr:ribonuclease HIII [bacterium]
MNKFELYGKIKLGLVDREFIVNPFREIQFGIQFVVFKGNLNAIVRIYEGKKGVRVDLSQVDNPALVKDIHEVVSEIHSASGVKVTDPEAVKMDSKTAPQSTGDPDELIGVDESGKGDYFGPLVISGVFVNPVTSAHLEEIGVKDSKRLPKKRILELAPMITEICPHTVVILNNLVYNDVYEKFPNLNNVLAWGHARVIDNMQTQVHSKFALCDQFGHQSLIQNALVLRGIDIVLLQRPRAEDNLAVAAASILARAGFLEGMGQLEETFKMNFPLGSGPEVAATRSLFIERYGETRLKEVAKTHFKIGNADE